MERSNLFHTMAGGNCVTLLECRRSDKELFEFYSSLIPGGSRVETPLRSIVAEARAVFQFADFCRSNLVISHKKRIQLNSQLSEQLAPAGAVNL